MFRVLVTVLLLGGVGLGASVVWRDPNLRQALWERGGALLDEALGIQGRKKEPPKPAVAVKPAPQRPAPVVTSVPAQPPYVDRSPTPTAVERVEPKDRRWLDDVIATRAEKR